MDDERLAAIRERLSATSSGPWYATVNDLIGGYDVTTVDLPASERNPAVDGHVEIAWGITRQHAEFIVNAPADLAWLLAEVERLEAERDAATAHAERAELDHRATYAVLSRFSYAVQQTRWPKMDNSQWQAVIDLAHGRPITVLIAEARAALAEQGEAG